MTELVSLTIDGPVAVITLRRPEKRNALTVSMVERLESQLQQAVAASHTRAIMLTHEGPVFCAGWDIVERLETRPDSSCLSRTVELLLSSPVPIVASLHGGALGAGMALVAASDIVVAAESAEFAFSEVRLGVTPALVSLPVLHRVPAGAAAELFLTGRMFAAPEARALGLVSRSVEVGAVNAVVGEILDELLAGAPGAIAETKRLLLEMGAGNLADRLGALEARSEEMFSTPEATEGLQAFREDRDPAWLERVQGPATPPFQRGSSEQRP